jgi:coenzyme F420-reducing hydrogenase gamma subunit
MPNSRKRKPKLAVWKFTSCDGCQLTVLDSRAEFLTLFNQIDLAYFPEASSSSLKGPFDLSLVEGSISTPDEAERIRAVRQSSKFLVTMGACASAGGLQALRNFSDVEEFASLVYPLPEHIETLETATPVSEHVKVDYELRGCPVNQAALQDVIKAFLFGEPLPKILNHSVCGECKKLGLDCLMRRGIPCMGPLTYAGCGALCPSYNRGCAGCYGPQEHARPEILARYWRTLGVAEAEIAGRVFRGINAYAGVFREGATTETEKEVVTGEPQ